MDYTAIAAELEASHGSQVADVQAIFAAGPPASVSAQRAVVNQLAGLASALNTKTVSGVDDVGNATVTPWWMSFGGRELDYGDIILALGHRWEELAVPDG